MPPFARFRNVSFVRVAPLAAALLLAVATAARADEPSRPPSPAPSVSPSASPSAEPSAAPTPAPPLQWRAIGPAVSGGRVATVAGTDLDPALFYAGAAGGGVWKSTNGGIDWSPVFDHAGSLSIGAIAVSPKDAADVWVGTGEAWPRNDVIAGDGIYHTTDGGRHWTRMGLEATSQIARIAIDPRDPNRLLVAALGDPFKDTPERGVFRSTDGGKTWTKTLYVDASTGASDLAVDPNDPQVVYAGMWTFRRSAWHFSSGGPQDGLYKSTDGGATWHRLTGAGLPPGTTGRIGLAIAPSDPKRVYALIESKEGLLWRSDDGGATWTRTSSNTLIDERPFYYTRLIVDPHDANHLFSVSVLLAESTNGGATWHVSGKRLHGDHHDAWISANGRTIVEANDGGVALSRDGGATWQWRNVIPVAQFYHVSADRETPYRVCGGLQDNGVWCAPSRTGESRGILPQDWLRAGGGDGTFSVADPRAPWTIVSSSGGGDNAGEIWRVDTRTQSARDVSPYLRDQNVVAPSRLRYRFNWETPLAFDPHDARVMYAGGNVLFRTTDGGMRWTPISGDLTRDMRSRQTLSGGLTLDVTGAETFDTLLAIAPSPLVAGQIWVSTDDGLVQLTRDGGKHWSNVSIPGLDADARVPALDASHRDAGTLYAAVDRHFVGDRAPYVYVTTDFGRTWRRITNGLPHAEVYAVREDPADPSVLYAGTAKGVWWSADRGASWSAFPAPYPPVDVHDLVVQPDAGDLVAATHGRGILIFDDLRPLRELALARREGVRLFAPRDARPRDGLMPTVNAAGAANPAPAIFTFWQATAARGPLALEIADAHGRIVRRIAGTHDEDGRDVPNVSNLAGFNRVAWDLNEDAPTPWRRAPAWDRGPDAGPPVLPGTYTVRLLRDGRVYARTLRVLPRPAVTAAAARAGSRFARAMNAELSALDDALNGLDNVRLQLADRVRSIHDATLAARARDVAAQAQKIQSTISSQPLNDQDDDFLEDLLRERVLTFLSDIGPGTPTQAQLTEARALRTGGESALAAYRTYVATRVRSLDDALRAAGLSPIDLRALPPKTKPDPNADEHARRADDDL
ncbi:MAG TPA: hypothetical protein VFB22_02360 [Candidatus Baltobacteraceae bacterium]|nr:hypothetical protein [Candidatus Baltobacteraceae bacterium]